MDSDDDFLDDGVDFDAIPAGTLLQLEQTAWQATQAALQQTGEPLHSTVAVGNEYSLNKNRPHGNAPAQRRESSFYGDVEVIDLDADILEDNNDGEGSVEVVNSNPPVSQNVLRGHGPDQRLNVPVRAHQPEPDSETNYVTRDIGARIEEFSRQYDAVNEQLASAREDATKKAGEVAILRANLNKQAQEFERTIASLRAQLAEVTTKSKGAQQAAIDDRQKLETENLFLREELRDETLRANNLRAKNRTEPPQTPRKQRTLPFRDGFDDDEIGFASPTKSSGGRSKRGTPSGHGKRKRKISDTSIHMPPLQLSQSNQPLTQGDHVLAGLDTLETRDYNSGGSIEEGIYITQVLNHKSDPHGESDLEIMAGLAFPSEPKRKISSIVLETMSGVTSNYPVKYAHCLIQLWDRALVEKFYQIVPVFMASIKFILLLDLYSIGPQLIAELAGILQASIYVNAATRFEHSAVSSKVKGESRRTPRAALHPDVDSTAALEILYLLALACRQDDNFHEQLWRNVHFDILLMTLNDHQPLQGIVLSLKILSTSLRRGSFGTIHASETEQREIENHFIERVTCLLFQRIEPDEGNPDYLPLQICYMRLEALTFLEMITYHGFNSVTNADASKSTIVSYPLVLPRLFRTLYDEMDRLYTRRPEHDLRTALINRLMHLIYKLIRSGGGKSLHEGLSRLSGAKQKHRLVLSRLAFSEGQFLEAGITEETMEMARRLLEEEDMSPEEAEALFDAFPTGGRLSSREGTQNEQ